MVKKLYKYILLFILFINSLFSDSESGSGRSKKEYVRLYVESKKLSKRVVELTNSLVDRKEKNKKIEELSSELDKLEEQIKEEKPVRNIEKVTYDKIITKIHDDKTVLKFYSYSKENVYESNIASDGIISREIDMEDVLNLSKMKNKTKEVYTIYVTLANLVIKDTDKIFKDIEEDIRCNRNYDNNKYKIQIISEKIKKIKDNYYEFKHNRYIYELENDFELKEIDKAFILKDDSKVDELLKKTQTLLDKIEEYKKGIKKEETKEVKETKEDKKPITTENKKMVKEEKQPKLLLDIIEASNVIEKDVKVQAKMIEKLEDDIISSPTFEIKNKRINFFENILNNTLKFTMNINIFKIYRNKKLTNLINGFILNNNIRTMRKSLTNSSICNYITLSKHIKQESDILISYERICNDSMYQVSILKEEFLDRYGYLNNTEIKKLYLKLESLEAYIGNELDRINESKYYLKTKIKKLNKS